MRLNDVNDDYPVSFQNFPLGFRFITFDFLPNCSDQEILDIPLQQGYMDLEISFRTAVAEELMMMIFAYSNETLMLDKLRVASYNPIIN